MGLRSSGFHEGARLVKGRLTASTVFDCWRTARRRRALAHWRLNGRPVPAPSAVKHSFLLEYARQYELSLFLETGTFWGDTVAAMRRHFRSVTSIELEPRLARHSQRRFAPAENVTIVPGDSARELAPLVRELPAPALFWLDGHYSGGDTAPTEPLGAELLAVMQAPTGSVVLIDDARTFTGPPRLNLGQVRRTTQSRFTMEVRDDVIRLVPRLVS